jgi:Flp pilus assembly pilin Flp
MVDGMRVKEFFLEEQGVVAIEYVIFAAAIGTLMVIGVGLLFDALGTFFSSWATYFGG